MLAMEADKQQHNLHYFNMFPGRKLNVLMFEEVKNAKQLLNDLILGKIELAFINTNYIIDMFQILVAANKALYTQAILGGLITRNIHAELVFNLGANRNIAGTLKKFGITEHSTNIIIALFDANETKADEVRKMVAGKEVQFHANFCDKSEIMQHYEITLKELEANDLLGSITTRIAIAETKKK